MWKDVWALWFSPGELFRSLRERPRWKGALALVLLVSAAGFLVTADEMIVFARQAALGEARGEEAKAQIDKIFDHGAFRAVIVAGPALSHLVAVGLYAALTLLVLVLTGGGLGPRPYSKLLLAGVWAKLVEVPHMILWVPLVKLKETPEIFFGPAALVDVDTGSRMFRLLASFDLFNLWFIAVLIIGVRTLFDLTTGRAVIAVGLPWLAWQLLRLAWG